MMTQFSGNILSKKIIQFVAIEALILQQNRNPHIGKKTGKNCLFSKTKINHVCVHKLKKNVFKKIVQ